MPMIKWIFRNLRIARVITGAATLMCTQCGSSEPVVPEALRPAPVTRPVKTTSVTAEDPRPAKELDPTICADTDLCTQTADNDPKTPKKYQCAPYHTFEAKGEAVALDLRPKLTDARQSRDPKLCCYGVDESNTRECPTAKR